MANEKWTPGPWTKELIINHPWGPEYEVHGPGGDEEGAVICSVGCDAVEANANLICAAPELYDLAVMFHSVLDNIRLNMDGQDRIRDEVWKIIQKARGEASE